MDVKAKAWVTSFTDIYQAKDVTPYMHALAMHMAEFIDLNGGVVKFTQQGLEKLNDVTTKQFQCATNHQESQSLRQVLEAHKNTRGYRAPTYKTCTNLQQM